MTEHKLKNGKVLLEAMQFAHACKEFDMDKKIPEDALQILLESARLTPSSFGLEPTRLLIVRSLELKKQIEPLCWFQKQISTCSELVIFKSKIKDLKAPTDIRESMRRRDLDERYMERLISFQSIAFGGECGQGKFEDWVMKQAYLMASSLVNCASILGIDSCYLEGFEREKLENLLGIDPREERIALLVALGYRVREPKSKNRIAVEELCEIK